MSTSQTNESVSSEPDESVQLLADEERDGCPTSGDSQPRGPTPLPLVQLAALVAVHIADPITYKQMLPYINQLLADLHIVSPEQVGFYSGFIVRILLWP